MVSQSRSSPNRATKLKNGLVQSRWKKVMKNHSKSLDKSCKLMIAAVHPTQNQAAG